LWRFDLNETISRIKVVLTAFVDYANISIGCGFVIWNDPIDLVQFERCGIATVVDAYGE
jgi:hypothetical protein